MMEPLEIVGKRPYNKYASKMKTRIEAGVVWMNTRTDEFWDEYAKEYELDRASLLDGHWLDLDISTLDLRSSTACVLGQAGGEYRNVARYAGLTSYEASKLGFMLHDIDYGLVALAEFTSEDWSNHTELWVAKINQLRQQRDKLNRSKADPTLDINRG